MIQLTLETFQRLANKLEQEKKDRTVLVAAHMLLYGTTAAGELRGFSRLKFTGQTTHSHCW